MVATAEGGGSLTTTVGVKRYRREPESIVTALDAGEDDGDEE